MRKKNWQQRALALINTFSLVLQLVFPALFGLANPAYAVEITPEIDFTKSSNSFKLTADTDQTIKYSIYYTHADNLLEAVTGEDTQTPTFEKTVFAGTCSTGGCTNHQVKRGLIKWQSLNIDITTKFILDKGEITSDTPYQTTDEELTPEEEVWLYSSDTPPPSPTPTPTLIIDPSPSIEPSPIPSPIPSPTPIITTEDTESGELFASVISNDISQANLFDLELTDSYTSASISTDKPDYAPTDIAVISGIDFIPETTYSLTIASTDDPATSTNISITTDANGSFTHMYQLDGIYRPNYSVELKDASGQIIATTTFTDAPVSGCTIDSAGANDEPGQKDLNKMCVNYASLPTSISVSWNWDEIGWSGSNSGDACSLYDTDSDGFANYSLCVQVANNPATYQNRVLFSCTDGKADRCTGSAIVSTTSTCAASVQNNDPFPGPPNSAKGDAYPQDTVASCTVNMSDVGGSASRLLDVCSYPSQQPNSDPSDCILFKSNSGKLEVIKKLIPTDDTGLFNLQIDGTTYATNVGNDGATGTQVVSEGSHSVGETAGTSTLLTNYSASIICKNSHGTGAVVSTTGTGPWNISVADETDIVCTITNTRVNNGSITIVKDAVPNNAQDFSFTTTGVGLSSFSLDDDADATLSNTKVFSNLASGTYSVSEGVISGWTQTSAVCSDGSPISAISLAAGENVTCTFTNTKDATLTLVKTVTNDNGGNATAADFQGKIDGTNVAWGTPTVVSAASHTASETNLTGYTASNWGGDCAANGTITLLPGDNKTCSITNNDIQPKLTVTKIVQNHYGGTKVVADFPLYVNTTSVTSGIQNAFNAGTYTVSETSSPGYTGVITGDCLANGSITLAAGDIKSCTITNTDSQPQIKVVKVVVNDNGGIRLPSYFPLFVDNNMVINEAINSFNAGIRTVTETGDPEYAASYSGDCDSDGKVTLTVGGALKTCTITNDDISPSLTLVKEVTNNNGGTATASAWTLTASGPTGFSGVGPTVLNGASFDAGTYTLSESGLGGYSAGDWLCTGVVNTGSTITLALGQSATCTIINDDQQAYIVVNKTVDNKGVGTAVANDFLLTVDGHAVLDEVAFPVNPGTHTVAETNLPNYTAGTWGTDCAADGSVTVALGETKTCTITNTQQVGTITVNKVVNPTNDLGKFNLLINGVTHKTDAGNGDSTGAISLAPGTYSITEVAGTDTNLSEYVPSFSGNCALEPHGTVYKITLAGGEDKTCTITNTKKAKVIVTKQTTPSDSTQSFHFTANYNTIPGFDLTNGQSNDSGYTLDSNQYWNVTEEAIAGWDLTSATCDNSDLPNSINPNPGQTVTCTFVNTIHPTITLVKNVINDNGGTADPSNWTLGITGVTSGAGPTLGPITVDPNTDYTISEAPGGPVGYTASTWTCDSGVTPTNNPTNAVINLAPGTNVTCTVTNDDVAPQLQLSKIVINDNGGTATASAWTLQAQGTKLGFSDSGDSTTFHNVEAGITYNLSESGPTGYTDNWWSCTDGEASGNTVKLSVGQQATCSITNNDVAPSLTLVKEVTNDNGGTATASAWTLSANGLTPISGAGGAISGSTFSAGTYTLSESGLAGYNSGDWLCTGVVNTGSTITLALGQSSTCTIINNDIQPTLTVIKEVVGSTLLPSAFNLWVDSTSVSNGVTNGFNVGTYTVSETPVTGFSSAITGDCDASGSATLALADNKTCTITNTRDTGSIVVTKLIDADGSLQTTNDQTLAANWQFDVDGTGDDTTDAIASTTNANGIVTFSSLKTGEYTVIETKQDGYDLIGATCGTQNGTFDNTDSVDGVTVAKSQSTSCTFINTPNGTIHGYKWSDDNGDQEISEEDLLSGWNIQLYRSNDNEGYDLIDSMLTDAGQTHFGWYWFEHLIPGDYKVCEISQTGWQQTYPSNEECHFMTLPDQNSSGFQESLNAIYGPEYNFGNQFVAPEMTIEKFNNRWPNTQAPGSDVQYTIILRVSNNSVINPVVTDLLPQNITYRHGSYQAVSSIHGVLSITEPTYASPGKWTLPTLAAGEVVTLTYMGDVSGGIKPGTYKDIAWAKGLDGKSNTVLASAIIPGKLNTTFVGTAIIVDSSYQTNASVNIIREEEGMVLGVTTELPATGINSLWLFLAAGFITTGTTLQFIAKKRKSYANH